MEYHTMYEREEEGVGRAVARQRFADDLHGVPTPVPGQRRLPGLLEGAVLRGRDGLPEVQEGVAVLPGQGPFGVLLSVLRTPRLPDGRDDLPQEHDELAA